MGIVLEHHPLARQAQLRTQSADAGLLLARGGFDPKAYADVDRKYFQDKQYYDILDAGLKVPTWFGIELKAGYEQSQGDYLNPERGTPGAGLWYAGITVPIGQGLFIDERRAELRKAQIMVQASEAERLVVLNDLVLDAAKAYWEWFGAYNAYLVLLEGSVLAVQRLDATRAMVVAGDRPPIDTLEATIQVQNRELEAQQGALDQRNAALGLGLFLWAEGFVPLELDESARPYRLEELSPSRPSEDFFGVLEQQLEFHPELLEYQYKLDVLGIDLRWKLEKLKPDLTLSYNPLMEATGESPWQQYQLNNYKLGLSFSMPLFLRKERGDLALTQIKIEESQLQFATKRAQVRQKALAYFNEWSLMNSQLGLYRQNADSYRDLMVAERSLFEIGESSLFMVNSRESSYISSQLKWIEAFVKNQKADAATQHALARIPD